MKDDGIYVSTSKEKAEQQVVSEQKVITEVDCFLKKRRSE